MKKIIIAVLVLIGLIGCKMSNNEKPSVEKELKHYEVSYDIQVEENWYIPSHYDNLYKKMVYDTEHKQFLGYQNEKIIITVTANDDDLYEVYCDSGCGEYYYLSPCDIGYTGEYKYLGHTWQEDNYQLKYIYIYVNGDLAATIEYKAEKD